MRSIDDLCLYSFSVDHRYLHAFPTRRSSDLRRGTKAVAKPQAETPFRGCSVHGGVRGAAVFRSASPRSEEHTSELQSRGHLVCRLLLEKRNLNNGQCIPLCAELAVVHIGNWI